MRRLFSLLMALSTFPALAAEPPVIPVVADAFQMWDHWAFQRIGARAYMRSTCDRRGNNERADASHFLYQQADDFNVTLDVQGPGLVYFVRYNHWHGSPWHYEVDHTDHIVEESAPLAMTWSDTRGADLSWVPIGFEKAFRMAYSRTFYGTGYYIYNQYVAGSRLSQPIRSWNGETTPPAEVLQLVGRAGSDIAPEAGTAGVEEASGVVDVPATGVAPVWTRRRGAGVVRAIDFAIPRTQALEFSNVRLQIHWDSRAEPSVDAPAALFFGAGILYNRDDREYLVKSFPMVIRFAKDVVYLSCYFPMPFFESAAIRLLGDGHAAVPGARWRVRYEPFRRTPNEVGYFHATYKDFPAPEKGKDLVLLDTTKTEGGGDWSGNFVGTEFIFSHDAVLNTLEGDPRFFFDDSQTPQAQGTGTEEWGGGGDYWGGLDMTLPFVGHPTGAKNAGVAAAPEDKVESAYRFLLSDLMPFGRNARIQLEHGGTNESTQHYETVTYWYGIPAPSLIRTDDGDEKSEREHPYHSPDASPPYEITSRYEWGPDTMAGEEIYPAQTDKGRKTKTASEFTLKIDPRYGVLLRRKLDCAFPNQRAEVFVESGKSWKPAGVWYLAGSSACVFSNPGNHLELGATQHVIQTSNRRFRDDEFLIPRALTRGRNVIRIKVQFTPVSIPLFAGEPIPELAWSEMRYTAYSFVMPKFKVGAP